MTVSYAGRIRPLLGSDDSLLWEFVQLAAISPDDQEGLNARAVPSAARWLEGWKDGELGVCFEAPSGEIAGAAWARRFPKRDALPDLPEMIIAVRAAWRHRGLGAELVRALQAAAVAARCGGVYVTVSRRNAPAMRLYEAAGFEERDSLASGLVVAVWATPGSAVAI